jgi:CBS-domain-containing membrane protein
MNAAEVMTTNVITVKPEASVQEVAQILLANRISALPVVDGNGELCGIVSEGDLLRRAEAGTEERRSWWLQAFRSSESLATEFVKSHSRRVADVMTADVITVKPDTGVEQIAGLLQRKHIKRVPVVRDGEVIGIVSRANLLQAVANPHHGYETNQEKNSELRERVLAQLKDKPWTNAATINVLTHDGIVDLWGITNSEKEKQAIRVAVEVTPGVTAVNDNLAVLLPTYGDI